MTDTQRLVLLVSGDDQPGLVSSTTGCIAGTGGNITHAEQHIDDVTGRFHQRIEFDASLGADEFTEAFTSVAQHTGMQFTVHQLGVRQRLALLVTTAPHCAADLLARCHSKELGADVACVVSNSGQLAEMVGFWGVPFHHVPATGDDRAAHEASMIELIDGYDVDTVVLARYMRILTPGFTSRYENRCINIHHSFLPAFKGADPYRQAYMRGVKMIGATAHYVTPELDEGPIIAQAATPVSHRHSPGDLKALGRDVEVVVLANAVRAHLEHRVIIDEGRTIVFG